MDSDSPTFPALVAQLGAGRQEKGDGLASLLVQILGVRESGDLKEGFGSFMQNLLLGFGRRAGSAGGPGGARVGSRFGEQMGGGGSMGRLFEAMTEVVGVVGGGNKPTAADVMMRLRDIMETDGDMQEEGGGTVVCMVGEGEAGGEVAWGMDRGSTGDVAGRAVGGVAGKIAGKMFAGAVGGMAGGVFCKLVDLLLLKPFPRGTPASFQVQVIEELGRIGRDECKGVPHQAGGRQGDGRKGGRAMHGGTSGQSQQQKQGGAPRKCSKEVAMEMCKRFLHSRFSGDCHHGDALACSSGCGSWSSKAGKGKREEEKSAYLKAWPGGVNLVACLREMLLREPCYHPATAFAVGAASAAATFAGVNFCGPSTDASARSVAANAHQGNAVPGGSKMRVCGAARCGRVEGDGVKLRGCSGCVMVTYCDRECQKTHWPLHKVTCHSRAGGEAHEKNTDKKSVAILNKDRVSGGGLCKGSGWRGLKVERCSSARSRESHELTCSRRAAGKKAEKSWA
ncbi:unnamed protein product [Closterium sp. NIES-64]|nr:unnamed protein product [Closterium sp. NIES-64]